MGKVSKNVYASVKSYSKRGKLLSTSSLQTLAESRDLEELVTRIKNTPYADAMSDIPKPYTAQGIENALRGHLASVHYSIAKTAGDSDILDAYYLRFIITNLKMILKGKALGKSQEQIEPHVNLRAEELVKKRDVVVRALVAKDLEEAAASLSSVKMAEEVSKAVSIYAEGKNLQVFDTYFDKILYSYLGKTMRTAGDRETARLVGTDIDFYNILSTLRGKFWGMDEQQIQDLIVVHTASAPRELLARMASAATLRDAFAELASTRYKDLIPQTDNELDALAEFERAFEIEAYKAANRSFSKMFSFATIVGITKLTLFEVRNLAAIAFAVEQGIAPETVMSKIISTEPAAT